MNKVIDGYQASQELIYRLSTKVAKLRSDHGIMPSLRVVLVGSNPASEVYVKNKQKKAEEVGIDAKTIKLDENITQNELVDIISGLNEATDINAILVQLPLPKHIDSNKIINLIDPKKDVDGFSLINVGSLSVDRNTHLKPCTPSGCLYLIKKALGSNLSGLNAVIIGRSNIVGKPMLQLLLHEHCTVTVAHSKTKNIQEIARVADILIAAVGKPKFITSEWIKDGATVIDVGINRTSENKIVGDVDFDSVYEKAKYITPVPKGVGPMTIAFLLKNTVTATCMQNNIKVTQ